jgi:acetyl-CoA carboxylase biotin carboxylase subunit
VLLKASGGGGGRGMKVARDAAELRHQLPVARAEAKAFFNNDEVYFERYLDRPRHIEVQILGDGRGACVHLGERDCTMQRSHQKVLEEAPSPVLTPAERVRIGEVAIAAMTTLGYRGAGTLEFLYQDGHFAFIEMNTRIQVEHGVTEMVTGTDLVRESILIAAGAPLSLRQREVEFDGAAIEFRVYAEDPETGLPSPGIVANHHAPGGLGVRVETALYDGYRVPVHYDPLIAKLIVHASDRRAAINRAKAALHEYVIQGIKTNIPLHLRILEDEDFVQGRFSTNFLKRFERRPEPAPEARLAKAS